MDELLQNPAVQAGVAPFVVALAVAVALARTRFLGLAQVAGFLVLVALSIGFSFQSLTATRKLVLLGAASGLGVLAIEALPDKRKLISWVVTGIFALGTVWMLWRLLAQRELPAAALAGVLGAAFVAFLVASTLKVSQADPVAGSSAGLMLGLGMGALGVLGASAVLGSVAISVGASAGAALLVQMLRGQPASVGSSIALPAATVAALAGVLASQSGSLPWYCLPPMLATPWATRLVPGALQATWLRAVAASALALIPMLIAIGLAWWAAANSA